MPSFLHTADVHLEARLRFLGARGREHRANIRAAFQRCVDLALERRVDAFLIAGDLFDSNRPGRASVEFVRAQFARLAQAGIAVRVVPGTHDALTPSGVYAWAELEAAGDVRVYRGQGPGGWDVERLPSGLTIYARPTLEKGGGLSALAGRPRDPAAAPGCEVALVHAALDIGGNDEEDYVLYPDEVAASGLAYIAAGHWHVPRDFGRGGVAGRYPGSPEPVSLDPRDGGQALLVQLEPGRPARVEAITVGRIRVEALDWDVTGDADGQALEAELVRRSDPDLVLAVRLRGVRGPGWTRHAADIAESFAASFFHLVVEDEAVDGLAAAEVAEPSSAGGDAAGLGTSRPATAAGLAAAAQEPPAGPVARRFAERLRARLAEAGDDAGRRRAAEALRLGLALLEGRDPW